MWQKRGYEMRDDGSTSRRKSKYYSDKTSRSATERQHQNETGSRQEINVRRSTGSTENRQHANIPVRRINPIDSDPYLMNGQSGHDSVYGYGQPVQRNRNIQPNEPFNPVRQNQQNGYYPGNQSLNGYIQNDSPERVYLSPEPQKRKRKHGFGRFILSILLIASLLCGIVFGYAFTLCSKTNYVKSQRIFTAADVMYDDEIYNVLLVGTDKESNGASRSDTMLLMSIDRKHKQLKMTSFLRDMWVEIPGYGNAKLNAAFAYGGADLMMKTIENSFKIRIDNYILVDFDMFKSLIDGLGGVDVDITENEASFINRTTHARVSSGINHLDGDYALIYVRIRKLDSDFMRTQRQRKVLTAIIRQVQEQGIISSVSAASDVLPYITTDISALELTVRAFSALEYITYGSGQLQIPLDGAYSDKRIDGQAVLKVDFEKNISALQEFIYG